MADDFSISNETLWSPEKDNEAFSSASSAPSHPPTNAPTIAEPSLITSTDSTIIRETLRAYGSLYIVFFLLFCILRRRYPKLYNVRSWAPEIRSRLAITQEYGFFSWAWRVFYVSDDEFMNHCGMDALCFVRALRLGEKLCLVGMANALFLIPLYWTAEESEETAYLQDPFIKMSIANLPNSSSRFAGPVLAAYIVILYSMHLISKEYDWFIEYRHKYLSRRVPANYTVYVSGIPPEYRSSYALSDYFQQCSRNAAVMEAHIATDIPSLEAKVARRAKIVAKLEHSMALEKKKGVTQTHRTFHLRYGVQGVANKVDSIEAFEKELDQLNNEITSEVSMLLKTNDKRRRHLTRTAGDSSRDAWIKIELSPTSVDEDRPPAGAKSSSLRTLISAGHSSSTLGINLGTIKEQMSPTCSVTSTSENAISAPGDLLMPDSGMFINGSTSITTQLKMVDESPTSSPGNILPFRDESCQPTEEGGSSISSSDDKEEGGRGPPVRFQRQDSPPHPFLQILGLDTMLMDTTEPNSNEKSGSASNSGSEISQGLLAANTSSSERDESPLGEGEGETPECQQRDLLAANTSSSERDESSLGEGEGETPECQQRDLESAGGGLMVDTGENNTDSLIFPSERSNADSVDESRRTRSSRSSRSSSPRYARRCNSGGSKSPPRSSFQTKRLSRTSSQFMTSVGRKVGSGSRSVSNSMRSGSEHVAGSVKKVGVMGVQGVKKVGEGSKVVGHAVKKAVKDVNSESVRKVGAMGVKGVKKAGSYGASSVKKAADYGIHTAATSAAAVVPMLKIRSEGTPRDAGFVVFNDLYTTQAVRQMLQHPSATKMTVEGAPDPKEVFWLNVGLPNKARRTGRLLSLAATITLCFFWSIPVAFLSSLTEVNSLKETLPFLESLVERFPIVETWLALIAPLLLLSLNDVVLPFVLKWFATWEGHISSPALEASLFVKLCAFMLIQTFFVSAVSGTISAELSNILDDPERIVDLLANSLPAQSSYFLQICFVFTFFLQGLDLLRIHPLGMAFIRRYFIGPNLTAKERRTSSRFVNSLEDPPEFWHAEIFAQVILFFVIFFVYSTLAPCTTGFLGFCLVVCESGYRYNFIHNHKPNPDSGGRLWKGFIQVLMVSMLIGELTLVGLMVLKGLAYAVPALMPLIGITILYMVSVIPKRNHVSDHLPTISCVEMDQKNREQENTDSQFATNKYLQPALQVKILTAEEVWLLS